MLARILVPVRGDGMGRTVMSYAARLAHRHKAHIVVAHCRMEAADIMPYSTLLPAFARSTIAEQVAEMANQEEQALRAELHAMAEALDLREGEAEASGAATVSFIEEAGRMAQVIKHRGRLADLVVVAQPDRDRNLGTNALKSALFQTGRPVLMCPKGDAPEGFGGHVAVGWNGSLEAARAVGMTLDLARAAEKVSILAAGGGEPHGATAEELLTYYAARGITASIHRFEARQPGRALLAEAASLGADHLIMGAYGQSHERETLFGGNTQWVVDEAELPVVMAH